MNDQVSDVIGRLARVRMPFRIFILIWGAMLVTLFLASLDARAAPPSVFHIDKLMHVAAYLVMGLAPLLFVARLPWAFLMAATLLPIGIGIEVLQDVTGGRTFSIGDMKANVLGVFLAVAIGAIIRSQFWPRRQS